MRRQTQKLAERLNAHLYLHSPDVTFAGSRRDETDLSQHGVLQVEKGAQVAAGAVVPAHSTIPAGEIWGGNPAKKLRALKPEEAAFISKSAKHYAELGSEHIKAIQ